MISFVEGLVAGITPDGVVVQVGGVGLDVQCAPRTLARLRVGEQARLSTALVVREDSMTLFGFGDSREREAFDVLQSVTGIGPRTAQGVLATLTVDELAAAIATGDLKTLARPAGIGPKAAARIALELKDRLPAPSGPASRVAVDGGGALAPGDEWSEQVIAGLVSLGWSPREARAGAEAVAGQAEAAARNGGPSVAVLLRAALRHLDRA